VDEALAELQKRGEKCVGLACEHAELCFMGASSGESSEEIRRWLERAIENAKRSSISRSASGKLLILGLLDRYL
jgi:hypothetical protein